MVCSYSLCCGVDFCYWVLNDSESVMHCIPLDLKLGLLKPEIIVFL